ncbi:hypothetical protein T492DRAFT_870732 [Pavlovales sp. CCMP2436]|nr:hypothetical protein T492DRAFT_870732 [Pavlovales sp. CCMP2436]
MALRACRVEPRAGRGLGVVAERPLAFGDVVCVAPALVSGDRGGAAPETMGATLRAIVSAQLDDATEAEAGRLLQACFAFCGIPDEAPSEDDFDAILRDLPTDAALRTLAERGVGCGVDLQLLSAKLAQNGFAEGVYPDACRFNHACLPNCLFFTRAPAHAAVASAPRELVVVAAEPIEVGDELTISYLPEALWHLPTDQRRVLLGRQYGFVCTCRRCHRPAQPAAVRRAERNLEAMACAECARAVLPAKAHWLLAPDEAAGAEFGGGHGGHVPLDEHESVAGERGGGYAPCAACGASGSEQALDAALVTCHRLVGASARVAAGGTLQHTREELCQLRELLDGEGRALSPTHWLACEVRWRLQAASAALLAHGAAGGADRLELLRTHAEQSLALAAPSDAGDIRRRARELHAAARPVLELAPM